MLIQPDVVSTLPKTSSAGVPDRIFASSAAAMPSPMSNVRITRLPTPDNKSGRPRHAPDMPSRLSKRLECIHAASSLRKHGSSNWRRSPSATRTASSTRSSISASSLISMSVSRAILAQPLVKSTGTSSIENAVRSVRRLGIALNKVTSSAVGAAPGAKWIRANRSGSLLSGLMDRLVFKPKRLAATSSNPMAAPQLISSARSWGSTTGRARVRSAITSKKTSDTRKSQGCVLWPDGARIAYPIKKTIWSCNDPPLGKSSAVMDHGEVAFEIIGIHHKMLHQ